MRNKLLSLAVITALSVPTFANAITLNVSADTTASGKPSGSKPTILVSSGTKGAIKFSLSMLPANTTAANIKNAYLTLFIEKNTSNPNLSIIAGGNGSWSENDALYPTGLDTSGTPLSRPVPYVINPSFLTFNVTDILKEWLAIYAVTYEFPLVISIDSGSLANNRKSAVVITAKESKTYSHSPILELELQ